MNTQIFIRSKLPIHLFDMKKEIIKTTHIKLGKKNGGKRNCFLIDIPEEKSISMRSRKKP